MALPKSMYPVVMEGKKNEYDKDHSTDKSNRFAFNTIQKWCAFDRSSDDHYLRTWGGFTCRLWLGKFLEGYPWVVGFG